MDCWKENDLSFNALILIMNACTRWKTPSCEAISYVQSSLVEHLHNVKYRIDNIYVSVHITTQNLHRK